MCVEYLKAWFINEDIKEVAAARDSWINFPVLHKVVQLMIVAAGSGG